MAPGGYIDTSYNSTYSVTAYPYTIITNYNSCAGMDYFQQDDMLEKAKKERELYWKNINRGKPNFISKIKHF
jgi:hypothetical protein